MKKTVTILGLMMLITIGVLIAGFATPASAETMKYKGYSYVVKDEVVKVSDVEGHGLGLRTGRAFLVFDNGETATSLWARTSDSTKDSGSVLQYITITFVDDRSTIVTKVQASWDAEGYKMTGTIINGTGRFEGIKGTQVGKYKNLPLEEGEIGEKGLGEGTFEYTLPSK